MQLEKQFELRVLRVLSDKTSDEMAEMVGITPAHWRLIEQGKRRFPKQKIHLIENIISENKGTHPLYKHIRTKRIPTTR